MLNRYFNMLISSMGKMGQSNKRMVQKIQFQVFDENGARSHPTYSVYVQTNCIFHISRKIHFEYHKNRNKQISSFSLETNVWLTQKSDKKKAANEKCILIPLGKRLLLFENSELYNVRKKSRKQEEQRDDCNCIWIS